MKTLVLDLATFLGFAFGDAAGVQHHGSFRLPSTGEDIGSFLAAYRLWLLGAVTRYQPELIVFESPILPDTTHPNTLRKLYSLAGITELVAKDKGIKCQEENLLNIRRHFIGSGRAPKDVQCEAGCKRPRCGRCRTERRKWIKESTETMCRRRGFRPADDNDADALALFSCVQAASNPNFELLGDEIPRAA